MSDLTARAIADLKAELAESKAAANRVTESMGSEILRLQGELAARNEQVEALQSWQDGVVIACGSLGLQPSEVAAHVENLRADRDATYDECEQQNTRAEAAEQELRAEKQRGNSAWDDGYAKSLERARVAERHRDDLIAQNKRDCQIMAATGVKETLLRDAIPVLAQQRDEARAKLAAIRAHLPALKRLHAWVSSDEMGKWTYLEGGTFYDDTQEMASIVADALEALEP